MLNRLAWNFTSMYKLFINVEVKTTYITKRDTIEDIMFAELYTLPHTYTNIIITISHNQTHTTSHTNAMLN
jgi:hypothetical protein